MSSLPKELSRDVWGANSIIFPQVTTLKDASSLCACLKSVLFSHSHTSHVTDIQSMSSGFSPMVVTMRAREKISHAVPGTRLLSLL